MHMQIRGSASTPFELSFYGPMVFIRNPLESFDRVMSESGFAHPFRQYRTILEKAVNNLFDPMVQAEVKRLEVEKGEKGLFEKLEEYGFKIFPIQESLESTEFFRKMDTEVRRGSIPVPIETGEFALRHGANAHGQQLLAMMHGFSKKERAEFIEFYKSLFPDVSGWQMWLWLFDAADAHHPNAPRWWRNLSLQQD